MLGRGIGVIELGLHVLDVGGGLVRHDLVKLREVLDHGLELLDRADARELVGDDDGGDADDGNKEERIEVHESSEAS